jgi:hypothetical protein
LAQHNENMARKVGGVTLYYELENTNPDDVPVDNFGVLPGESVVRVSDQQAETFLQMRGLTFAQAKLPRGVEVTVFLEKVKA